MEHKDYKLAAIMFTDIVGFSRMMENDEEGTLKTMEIHNRIIRDLVAKHRGKVIKTIGDAFLADFPTALDAVRCSLSVQEGIRDYSASGTGNPLTLRIGVHLGDIYFYENDALGEGINIASRLQSSARPGHINISREVYSQVSGKIPMRVNNLGQIQLKNISREIYAYEIITDDQEDLVPESPAPTPKTPESDYQYQTTTSGTDEFQRLRTEWRSIKQSIKKEWNTSLKSELQTTFQEIGKEIAGIMEPKDRNGRPLSVFENYKKKALELSRQAREGVFGHLGAYLGVNVALAYINFGMTSNPFPWCGIVALSWGIGVVSHLISVAPHKSTEKELQSLETLGNEDTKLLKGFQKGRVGFWTHLGSNLMIISLLMFIDFITGNAGISWSLIPSSILGLGMVGHAAGYPAERKKFKDFWKRISTGSAPLSAPMAREPASLVDARKIVMDIRVQLETMKSSSTPFGEDITPVMENYLKQLEELVKIEGEIDGILKSLHTLDMTKEEELLKQKLERQPSEVLRLEYNKSLFELEKQKKSVQDLRDQKELLELRIGSGVKSLRSLQIDLARIKGTGQEVAAFSHLKSRSEELNHYIEDYKEGLKEL
ncbi:MAG: hypothetical protein A2Z96_07035 [Spirochaetes bacterium GWB1_48_6]|nr:MAG: hypothetical protein A2Z96_07035 [Spirochaetes bacterium GWB1_48_6]